MPPRSRRTSIWSASARANVSPQLTIFAAPREFIGDFDRIQRNAIFSWTCLDPKPEVIVFGGGPTAATAAADLGVQFVGDLPCTASGAPLLDALFEQAQATAASDVIAYANPDVIFLQDVADRLQELDRKFGLYIAVGAPRNAAFTHALHGRESDWMSELGPALATATQPASGSGADLFVFPKGSLDPIPHVAIGRLGWDNWLLWRCAINPLPSIDITDAATLVHQDHSGSTHRGSLAATHELFGADVAHNMSHIGPLEAIARRSEIGYEIKRDGSVTARFRSGRSGVRGILVARWLRLSAMTIARRTPLRLGVDGMERWWKAKRSG